MTINLLNRSETPARLQQASLLQLFSRKGASPVSPSPFLKRTADILFTLAVSLFLAACDSASDAKSSFDIKDSSVPAAEGQLGWVDNNRVIFTGYEPGRYRINPDGSKILAINAIFIWDIPQNKITKYATINGPADLCVHDGSISYVRFVEKEKAVVLISGKIGEEQKTHLPEQRWFNPFSCRYYSNKPYWEVEGHATHPLLEEHGYLDFGPDRGSTSKNTSIQYYPRGAKEGIALPIGRREIQAYHVHYSLFNNGYLMWGKNYVDKKTGREDALWPKDVKHPVWWLTPDGKVTKEEVPYLSLMRGGSRGFYPTVKGIFLFSHSTGGPRKPGSAGGYLVEGERVEKLISGRLEKIAVSPDGCKVAFVHDPYDTERGKERFNRITVKMIDLCQGAAQ